MPSRATPLQCMEHKSEINRMFIEQLFQWWQLVPARPRGIVFNRGTERERERASKMLLGRRFTTKRDTCRMYRRLQRNGHNSGGLITTPRGESNRAYFSTLSIKSTPPRKRSKHRGIGVGNFRVWTRDTIRRIKKLFSKKIFL